MFAEGWRYPACEAGICRQFLFYVLLIDGMWIMGCGLWEVNRLCWLIEKRESTTKRGVDGLFGKAERGCYS